MGEVGAGVGGVIPGEISYLIDSRDAILFGDRGSVASFCFFNGSSVKSI